MPGSDTFQLYSFSVHVIGIVVHELSPDPFGPRNRVHSWAVTGPPAPTSVAPRSNEAIRDTEDDRNWHCGWQTFMNVTFTDMRGRDRVADFFSTSNRFQSETF